MGGQGLSQELQNVPNPACLLAARGSLNAPEHAVTTCLAPTPNMHPCVLPLPTEPPIHLPHTHALSLTGHQRERVYLTCTKHGSLHDVSGLSPPRLPALPPANASASVAAAAAVASAAAEADALAAAKEVPSVAELLADPEFEEGNLMHSING